MSISIGLELERKSKETRNLLSKKKKQSKMKKSSRMMLNRMTPSLFRNSLIHFPKSTIVMIVKDLMLSVKTRFGDTKEFMMVIKGEPYSRWIWNIKI